MRRVPRGLSLIAMITIVAATGAFFAGREWGQSRPPHPANADTDPAAALSASPAADPSAPPTEFPEGWNVSYEKADGLLPRFDQDVNGIRVGPGVSLDDGGAFCTAGEARVADAKAGAESGLAIDRPASAPQAALREAEFVECRGRIVASWYDFGLPAAPDAAARVASGENWFQVPHGATLSFGRRHTAVPSWQSQLASVRWQPIEIGGKPAALGHPLLDEGLGTAEVIIWDAERQLMTILRSTNVDLKTFLAIAAEVGP